MTDRKFYMSKALLQQEGRGGRREAAGAPLEEDEGPRRAAVRAWHQCLPEHHEGRVDDLLAAHGK